MNLNCMVYMTLFGLLFSCKEAKKDYKTTVKDPTIYHESLKKITDVMVHDIFSPPVASRIYGYTTIAGYEAGRHLSDSLPTLAGKIKHLSAFPKPEEGKEYCFEVSANYALLITGKHLIFSEDSITKQIEAVSEFYTESGLPKDIFKRSKLFGEAIAKHVIEWSKKDMYAQTRSYPKFTVEKNEARWSPTPPGYMDGIEPSWNKIRPMLLDSAAQFKPKPPTTFNIKDKNSQFYKEVMEVYTAVKEASEEEVEIAQFWDCNPFKLNVIGHVMHASKKISPGGHWVNIAGLACKQSKASFAKTIEVYAIVSIGLFDSFISCWDEKYRSALVRPETVINQNIDPDWLPLLQTPPFPEHTSGHSVASSSSAFILTKLFGENFAFDDDTEVEFGLPVRSFKSFFHAGDEASISRLYGGIHFKPAITEGIQQGKNVGQLVVDRLF